eukprot:Skav231365  [mRNA]  locus=scaffold1586:421931:423759:+ [translate_table: standard]
MLNLRGGLDKYRTVFAALVVIAKGPPSTGVAMASSSNFSEAVQKVVALETRKTDEAREDAWGAVNQGIRACRTAGSTGFLACGCHG